MSCKVENNANEIYFHPTFLPFCFVFFFVMKAGKKLKGKFL